jgi:hypothetical protein
MPLIKHEAIFYASGENAGTYSLFCLKADFSGNMEEKVWRCRSYDDNRQIQVPYYKTGSVRFPDFWNFESYKANLVPFRYALARAGEEAIMLLETPKRLEKFLALSGYNQYIFGELYKRKNKSDFYNSLFTQFFSFLDGESKFRNPLSDGQYSALSKCRINQYEIKYIDNAVYRCSGSTNY